MGDTVLYTMVAGLPFLAVVGLLVWMRAKKRQQVRNRVAKMVRNTDSLIHSMNPADIRRIGVIVNRIRTLARTNGMKLEQLGVSDGKLQSYTDRMHGRLVALMKPLNRPEGHSPPDAWRFEDETDTEIDIIVDTSELDALFPPVPLKDSPVAALLLEVVTDGTPTVGMTGTREPYSIAELLDGLTDGDIEGHIETNVERVMQPA